MENRECNHASPLILFLLPKIGQSMLMIFVSVRVLCINYISLN